MATILITGCRSGIGYETALAFGRRGDTVYATMRDPSIDDRLRDATAKEVGLFDEAIRLANRTPRDPKTLTRAAWDFADERPEFAVEAGLAALRWLVEGYGYEITGLDVWAAYANSVKAAEKAGRAGEVRSRIKTLVAREPSGETFVTRILGRELGL